MNQKVLHKLKSARFTARVREFTRPAYRFVRPYASINSLDRKIEKYLPPTGVFVEAGANDGLLQSNTLFLERKYGWNGILVEPIPRLYSRCVKNRRSSICINAALVPPSESGEYVELIDVDLMTQVKHSSGFKANEESLKTAEQVQGIRRTEVSVKGKTLSEVISESGHSYIDLLSLDVEGFEIQVLQGITNDAHFPKWILIETSDVNAVLNSIKKEYLIVEKLSFHDYLLTRVDT